MKVAINGFGRIGRLVFRILEDSSDFEVVAINDLSDAKELAYLLKYDSSHGTYEKDEIGFFGSYLVSSGRKIKIFSSSDPLELPWGELGVDIVFECSGHFTKKDSAYRHIEAGAKRVIISAPCKDSEVKTVVYGVNESILNGDERVISAASCTTNCLAPVLDIVNNNFEIVKGYMTTIHAYTNDQVMLDVSHKKGIEARRGRAGAINIIPTSTGAAKAIGRVIPSLDGKMRGSAMRVPVSDGSCVDLVLELKRNVSIDEINKAFISSVSDSLGVTSDPIVSSDIVGDTHGGVVDLLLTDILEVDGKQLVKIVAWYDNENGYSHQMVRCARYFTNLFK